MTFEDTLRTLVRARYPIIWIQTHEEERVLRYVANVAEKPKTDGSIAAKDLFLWSQSKGLEKVTRGSDGQLNRKVEDSELVDDLAVMARVIKAAKDGEGAIFVLRDMHRFLAGTAREPDYRFLRDAAHELRESKTTLIVTSPVSNLPIECEKDVAVLDLPLPTAEELGVRLAEALGGDDTRFEKPKNGDTERILKAGLGLTEDEFISAVKESIIETNKVDPHIIIRQKEQVIRKSGIVELFQSVEGLESVGGLDLLRKWVEQRALAFSDKAAKFGLRPPRGLFLTGPPGTGKTLTAKATASHLGVPLLWLKGDSVFSKYVGESEQNMQRVLKLADAVSPCILFIDECEKLLAGSSAAGAQGDSGVSRRVFGSLLTYMQEHRTPVLIIATANDPLNIPPEMMRRFDVVFFVDLPQTPERADILAIHIKKVKRDPKKYDIMGIADDTKGFSGSEIEQGVNEALFKAFEEGTELKNSHLRAAFKTAIPLAKSRSDEIEAMQRWSRSNAVPASSIFAEGTKRAKMEL
jgi:SpoVK/Ycf46/Vps4 family AAA+-type ATPase